jgi:hypothetical protein
LKSYEIFEVLKFENSYLMGVDAIDQTICPSVLGMTKCSIAFGQRILSTKPKLYIEITLEKVEQI